MNKLTLKIGMLAKLIVVAALFWTTSFPGIEAQAQKESDRFGLRIIYSGGLIGNIEPCG